MRISSTSVSSRAGSAPATATQLRPPPPPLDGVRGWCRAEDTRHRRRGPPPRSRLTARDNDVSTGPRPEVAHQQPARPGADPRVLGVPWIARTGHSLARRPGPFSPPPPPAFLPGRARSWRPPSFRPAEAAPPRAAAGTGCSSAPSPAAGLGTGPATDPPPPPPPPPPRLAPTAHTPRPAPPRSVLRSTRTHSGIVRLARSPCQPDPAHVLRASAPAMLARLRGAWPRAAPPPTPARLKELRPGSSAPGAPAHRLATVCCPYGSVAAVRSSANLGISTPTAATRHFRRRSAPPPRFRCWRRRARLTLPCRTLPPGRSTLVGRRPPLHAAGSRRSLSRSHAFDPRGAFPGGATLSRPPPAELQGCRACLLNKGHVRRILKKDGLEDYRVRPWPSDCGQGLGELARERVRELPQVGFTHLVERATRGRRCAQGSCDDARRADTHEPSGGASHCSSPHHSQGVESRIGPGHAERQKPSGPSCEK